MVLDFGGSHGSPQANTKGLLTVLLSCLHPTHAHDFAYIFQDPLGHWGLPLCSPIPINSQRKSPIPDKYWCSNFDFKSWSSGFPQTWLTERLVCLFLTQLSISLIKNSLFTPYTKALIPLLKYLSNNKHFDAFKYFLLILQIPSCSAVFNSSKAW